MWTGDDWNNNGRGSDVITIKTHYPQSNGILVDFDEQIGRAFVIIRNPMKSIPSFFNHIYETRNHLPVHSERAPVEEWVKWRNAYLDIEIAEYKKFICYWMDRYKPEDRLLITYEGITDDVIGAEVAKGLNEFLSQVPGVTTIDRESVPCIWRAVVKNEPPPQQAAQIARLQSQALNQPQNAAPVKQQGEKQEMQQSMNEQQNDPNAVYVSVEGHAGTNNRLSNTRMQQPPQLGQASYPQMQQQERQQQPGVRRRLDPGHHNSMRKGPNQPRPYTPEQLDSMMNMLLEVAERYPGDVRLYHIMMGYYEKIREARNKQSPWAEKVVLPKSGLY